MATSSSATPDPATSNGRRFLRRLERRARGLSRATGLLLVDTVAAIGFAGGLAGALSAIATGVDDVGGWLALVGTSALLRGLASFGARLVGTRVAGRAKHALRQDIVHQMVRRTANEGAVAGSGGRLMQLAVDEIDALDGYLSRFVPARRAAVAAPVLVLGAIALASPVTAAILAATLVPFVLLLALAGTASAGESRRQFATLSRLSGLFVDRLRALPVVLAFQAETREAKRLEEVSNQVAQRTLRVLRLAFVSSAVLEFFSALCVALVAVYAGFSLLGLLPFQAPERLSLASAFFALALAPEFYAPLRRLAAAYHDRQSAQTAAERLAAFDVAPGLELASKPNEPLDVPSPSGPPRIRFEDVTVHYLNRTTPAVQHLGFDVDAGRTIALVGPSGSGKTSALRLLLGAAPLAGGRVLIDGIDLRDTGPLSARTAWVSQFPLIIPGTLDDNLRLVRPDATQRELDEVVRQTGLNTLRARRGHGTAPDLGTPGGAPSGGECRRIALARALLRPSSLWLLDEPTAHLDARAEMELIALLARTRAGRTTVIATHSERLAAMADVVVRLKAPR